MPTRLDVYSELLIFCSISAFGTSLVVSNKEITQICICPVSHVTRNLTTGSPSCRKNSNMVSVAFSQKRLFTEVMNEYMMMPSCLPDNTFVVGIHW